MLFEEIMEFRMCIFLSNRMQSQFNNQRYLREVTYVSGDRVWFTVDNEELQLSFIDSTF